MGKYLKLLAAIMIVASCGKESPDQNPTTPSEPDNEPQMVQLDFTVQIVEQVTGTDAVLSWKAGDAMAFFSEGSSSTVSIDEEKETLEFTEEVTEGIYYAVYPASAANDRYGNSVMVDIPTSQSGALEETCILFAKADSENRLFQLRNMCALGSVTLGRNDIKKITISGNNDEPIAGTVYASTSLDGLPACAEADATEIILAPVANETFAAGTYYFAAVPGSLTGGMSFTLETVGGNMMIGKAYAQSAQLERATVMDFGTIDDISNADALRLRFIFGPEAGSKAIYDPEGEWPTDWVAPLDGGANYKYAIDGTDYTFFVTDQVAASKNTFKWDTNNDDGYADRIAIPSSTVFFGLPTIDGLKLTGAVVGQSRRGKADNAETKITSVGITAGVPESTEAQKTYVSGGELQNWPGWSGGNDKKVVDHVFELSGTQVNTRYYLNSDNADIGLYFSRLVLTYEKTDCAYTGFPEEWQQEGGAEAVDIYADADIRILFIGNSFTRDAVYHLPGMIKAAGTDEKIVLTHMYYGGRTAQAFYKHWDSKRDYTCYVALPGADDWYKDNAGAASTLAEMAARTDWDIITVQEHTGNQTSWYWTDEEKNCLQGIIDYAKAAKTGNTPEVYYVMSQAYLNLEKAGSNQCFTNEAEMYDVIVAQAKKVMTETDFDGIISTGTMLQNLRTSSLNDELHLTRDGFHMNYGISRYGAACTVFESIITPLIGKNLDGNTYRYSGDEDDGVTIPVTDENVPVALAAARAAIQKPYEITTLNQ